MRKGMVAAVLAGGLVAALAPSAQATTITVDTTGDVLSDDAVCSLREAVLSARKNDNVDEPDCAQGEFPGADTISLGAATYELTIAGNNEDNGLTGDLDHKLSTAGELNVVGAGQGQTIIDMNNTDRAFDLGNHDFSFSDLTIRDGSSETNGAGGAIAMNGTVSETSLTLTNVTISSSVAQGIVSNGGAIWFNGADDDDSLTVTDSVIDANEAGGKGGGIFASGVNTIAITASAITGNDLTTPGNDEEGGGLYLATGGVVDDDHDITDSTISGNSGAEDGGGISAAGGGASDVLTITRSVIADNDAQDRGGGVRSTIPKTEVVDSIIRDNDALGGAVPTGGGIDASVVGTDLDVIRSTLEGNETSNRGGAINFAGDAMRILNSTINGNTAAQGSAVQVVDGSGGSGVHTALFNHATVSGNTGASAIRAANDDDDIAITLRESILDQPEATACDAVESFGTTITFTSGGGNFDRGTTCSNDLSEQTENTNLFPLAANGGTSAGVAGATEVLPTQELPVGSVAVDAIAAASCTEDGAAPATQDQRGMPRPDPGSTDCDSGAYELSIIPAAGQPGGPPAPPSNAFSFGKLKLNKRKGIATLFVTLPGPGRISLAGKGVTPLSIGTAGGAAKLVVKPHKKGKQARRLRRRLTRKGNAAVALRVTYTPTGGAAATQTKKLKLKRKKR